MRNLRTKIAVVLAFLMVMPLFEPLEAASNTKGRKNTTIALGALTAYKAIKGHKREAIAAGVGTGIAYHRYRTARKRQRARRSRVARRNR